jgi:hypothetical protein
VTSDHLGGLDIDGRYFMNIKEVMFEHVDWIEMAWGCQYGDVSSVNLLILNYMISNYHNNESLSENIFFFFPRLM